MKNEQHLAHITSIEGVRVNQTISEHSRSAAVYAGQALESVGLYHVGYFAALIHDMGKAKEEYAEYLEKACCNEKVIRGSVNHTFAAVKFVLGRYYAVAKSAYDALTCEIIAIAVGSHHGLFDIDDPTEVSNKNGLEYRVKYDEDEIAYKESLNNFLNEVADLDELDNLFEAACSEIKIIAKKIEKHKEEYKANGMFTQYGYLARLVTSAVMEGDRRDTAEFLNGKTLPFFDANKKFWEKQLLQMDKKIEALSNEAPINSARKYISDACHNFGKRPTGIYRLTVPTGSGKTLSSLRYALTHAAEYGKKRIIFIIPLLSVLEQNAKEIHKYLDAEEMILEHHSNVVSYEDRTENLDNRELLTDTWASPVIISTLVQLLNILFSHKTAALRRMNALCDSVIIIDEVQSLPLKFAKLFSMVVNFLAECCNTTVVLCSATQPAFETLSPSLHVKAESELVTLDEEKAKVFQRTQIISEIESRGMSLSELADFASKLIENRDSLLVICNTKSEARDLYKQLKFRSNGEYDLYHLSTAMCPKHREETLNKIGKVPGKEGEKVLCVATQMVEAGIDFSFESVIRIEAGMDNVVQSAGRCNRGNEWGKICPVFVIRLKNEKLGPLRTIAEAQLCFTAVSHEMGGDTDLMSKQFISRYYQRYFNSQDNIREMRYSVKIGKNKDIDSYITDMLSMHKNSNDGIPYHMRQAFRTAGENCKVFEDNKTDVIVNYDEFSNECIHNLTSQKANYNLGYMKGELKKLKPYTVSIFEHELRKLKEDKMVDYQQNSGIIILDKSAYNSDFGVSVNEYSIGNDFLNL